jgi:hypothetical protein
MLNSLTDVFFVGLFEVRALQYLETIPESEPSGVNRILRSLGESLCPIG